jgi:hypothetical protein
MKRYRSSFRTQLFDDESTRHKLRVMGKWDAMIDDERNPTPEVDDEVEAFLKLGRTYLVTITIQEIQDDSTPRHQDP